VEKYNKCSKQALRNKSRFYNDECGKNTLCDFERHRLQADAEEVI